MTVVGTADEISKEIKMKNEKSVVTYQAANGETLDVCSDCESGLSPWPKNDRGEEFCTVSHGAHDSQICDVCDSDE